MGIKYDCFAYSEISKKCNCLKELYCKDEECRFYKPKKDVNFTKIKNDMCNYINNARTKGLL